MTTENRFWAKVKKTDTCWLWCGATGKKGYGNIGVGNKRVQSTHRYSYELHYGPIPDGLQVLHTCDVRNCVNPAHLFLGTNQTNQRDAANKGRSSGTRYSKHVIGEILNSKESNTSLSRRLGISRGHIWSVRQGHHRQHKLEVL